MEVRECKGKGERDVAGEEAFRGSSGSSASGQDQERALGLRSAELYSHSDLNSWRRAETRTGIGASGTL